MQGNREKFTMVWLFYVEAWSRLFPMLTTEIGVDQRERTKKNHIALKYSQEWRMIYRVVVSILRNSIHYFMNWWITISVTIFENYSSSRFYEIKYVKAEIGSWNKEIIVKWFKEM